MKTIDLLASAKRYIAKIRNPEKRKYAEDYLQYCLNHGQGDPPRYAGSYMAGQAVRLNVSSIIGETRP